MDAVKQLRKSFNSGVLKDRNVRKEILTSLFNMIAENEDSLCEAVYKDLKKPKQEVIMTELSLLKQDASLFVKNLDKWCTHEKAAKTFVTMTDSLYIQKQPFGVVLVIGAWNYPLLLSLQPLLGAIASGNCVLLKPSELAVNSDRLMSELLPKYVSEQYIRVVSGGADVCTKLLEERFDYIMYTGNSNVAKIVMAAAAKHLTPVTLELGGKSPAYVDSNCGIAMAAKRIAWGKFSNCGQTCIAPDYVLCHPDSQASLVEEIKKCIHEFYGEDPQKSADFARIINDRHFERVRGLVEKSKGKVEIGGQFNSEERYIAPTIITGVEENDSLMSEEIFGPVLPFIAVKSPEEAIEFINKGEKPLALYVFTNSKAVMHQIEENTTSGGLLINDTMFHAAAETLPFGGVGNSGMGCYHGKFSVDTFQHNRAVLNKNTTEMVNNLFRYPPYNDAKVGWAKWATKSNPSSGTSCLIS